MPRVLDQRTEAVAGRCQESTVSALRSSSARGPAPQGSGDGERTWHVVFGGRQVHKGDLRPISRRRLPDAAHGSLRRALRYSSRAVAADLRRNSLEGHRHNIPQTDPSCSSSRKFYRRARPDVVEVYEKRGRVRRVQRADVVSVRWIAVSIAPFYSGERRHWRPTSPRHTGRKRGDGLPFTARHALSKGNAPQIGKALQSFCGRSIEGKLGAAETHPSRWKLARHSVRVAPERHETSETKRPHAPLWQN